MRENVTSLTPEEHELYMKWFLKGEFTKDGVTYRRGLEDHKAVLALIPPSKKVTGKICHIGELTLTNRDMDNDYHLGLTVGNGKTLYWEMLWHQSGHVTVISIKSGSRRYISGDSVVTVHFK